MTPFPLLHSLILHPLHLLPPPLLHSQLMPAGRARTRERSVLHISPRCLSTSLFSVQFLSSCDKKSQLKCKLEFMPEYWMAVAVLCSPSGLMQDDMFVRCLSRAGLDLENWGGLLDVSAWPNVMTFQCTIQGE